MAKRNVKVTNITFERKIDFFMLASGEGWLMVPISSHHLLVNNEKIISCNLYSCATYFKMSRPSNVVDIMMALASVCKGLVGANQV
jgi:hypothetical protein